MTSIAHAAETASQASIQEEAIESGIQGGAGDQDGGQGHGNGNSGSEDTANADFDAKIETTETDAAMVESPSGADAADGSDVTAGEESDESGELLTEDESSPESDEMQDLASELKQSFAILHKTSGGNADLAPPLPPKGKMCVATNFTERKSKLLPRMKLMSSVQSSGHRKGNDLKSFLADITPLRNQIKVESQRRSEIRGAAVQSVMSNFKSSCHLEFKKFVPEVKRQAGQHHIPVETLLAMMTIESGGDCFASVAEGGTDPLSGLPLYSRGLFQVHSKFTDLHACSDRQKREIRNAKSIVALRSAPRCIENPVLNLSAAVKVLEDKARVLVKDSTPYEILYLNESKNRPGKSCWMKKTITVSGFEARRFRDKHGHWNRNLWRVAVSAYNGGERWVFRAKRNIEAFNSLHGTHVDPYDWDALKDYYFRRTLNHRQQLRYFGVQERDRDLDYAVLNVIYAENLVPRSPIRRGAALAHRNLAELWQEEVLHPKASHNRIPASKSRD